MIYLFSSGYYGLYRKDVLDSCCYPERHILRFRYSERYFPESVGRAPWLFLGQRGMVIFADAEPLSPFTADQIERRKKEGEVWLTDFTFYPLREVEIADIHIQGKVLVVDIRLGKFLYYGLEQDSSRQTKWDTDLKGLPNRPYPPNYPKQGYFFYVSDEATLECSTDMVDSETAWRSVIERINKSSLANCVTYQVLGIYQVPGWTKRARQCWNESLAVLAKKTLSGEQLACKVCPTVPFLRKDRRNKNQAERGGRQVHLQNLDG